MISYFSCQKKQGHFSILEQRKSVIFLFNQTYGFLENRIKQYTTSHLKKIVYFIIYYFFLIIKYYFWVINWFFIADQKEQLMIRAVTGSTGLAKDDKPQKVCRKVGFITAYLKITYQWSKKSAGWNNILFSSYRVGGTDFSFLIGSIQSTHVKKRKAKYVFRIYINFHSIVCHFITDTFRKKHNVSFFVLATINSYFRA